MPIEGELQATSSVIEAGLLKKMIEQGVRG